MSLKGNMADAALQKLLGRLSVQKITVYLLLLFIMYLARMLGVRQPPSNPVK